MMVATGGLATHVAIAFRDKDDILHVLESQDAKWFGPSFSGVQSNQLDNWLMYAEEAGFEVSWLPLHPDQRSQLDENKLALFFNENEGKPYDFASMYFAAIDTVDGNYLSPINVDFIPMMLRYTEKWFPEHFDKTMVEALNMRLDYAQMPTFEEIVIHSITERNMTIQELLAVPEQDDWVYSSGKAYTSSSFVISALRAAGLFADVQINAAEFTPKDVYQLRIYDTEFQRPEDCLEADAYIPYCQIMGKYRMFLPGYSSIAPYDHMFEHCPTPTPFSDEFNEDFEGC